MKIAIFHTECYIAIKVYTKTNQLYDVFKKNFREL